MKTYKYRISEWNFIEMESIGIKFDCPWSINIALMVHCRSTICVLLFQKNFAIDTKVE